jgi:hypothetical protein
MPQALPICCAQTIASSSLPSQRVERVADRAPAGGDRLLVERQRAFARARVLGQDDVRVRAIRRHRQRALGQRDPAAADRVVRLVAQFLRAFERRRGRRGHVVDRTASETLGQRLVRLVQAAELT